jgi:hypothetical protein
MQELGGGAAAVVKSRRKRPTGGFLYLVLTSAAVSWAQAHFSNPQHLFNPIHLRWRPE